MGLALIIPDLDFSGAHLGRVTLAENVPISGLAISGPDAVTGDIDAATYVPVYTPSATNQRSVVWSIQSGGAYATITNGGVLSVLPGASAASVTIRVTSTINPTIYAEKTISVTYGSQELPEGAIACDTLFSDGYRGFIESLIAPGVAMSYEASVFWVDTNTLQDLMGWYISSKQYSPMRFVNKKQEVCFDGYYYMSETLFPLIKELTIRSVLTQTGAHMEVYDEDGALIESNDITYTETDYTPNQTLPIFGCKDTANRIIEGTFRGGLHRLKVYGDSNFNNLLADFIPCFFNNNFGVWDVVAERHLIGADPAKIFGFGANWGTYGFRPHVINSRLSASAQGYLTDDRGWHTSRMFQLPAGCANVRYAVGSALQNSREVITFFDALGAAISSYDNTGIDRELAVPAGAASCRLSMPIASVDVSYIYDMSNGAYIWKGINVN